jgi:hypothetical protein
MRVRRALAATVAGGALLLGLGATPAPAATIVPVTTLGRNVVSYASGTSKWIASAQGEYVDDNYVTKPDPNALRGRGAVQETSGVKRVRIYDVQLQELRAGKWITVRSRANLPDIVDARSQAYAVAYTPTVRTCWWDDFVATYRVVNLNGVRRTNDVLVNKTTISRTFKGPRLATDPACPTGVITGQMDTPNELQVGDTTHGRTWLQYFGPGPRDPAPAPNLEVRVNWGDGLAVAEAPAGYEPNAATPDPNDYVLRVASFAVTDPRNERDDLWTLTGAQVGEWSSSMAIKTSNPLIVTQVVEVQPSTVLKDEPSLNLTFEGNNPDAWPVGTKEIVSADIDVGDPNANVDGYELRVWFSDGLKPFDDSSHGPILVEALHTPDPDDWYKPISVPRSSGGWWTMATGAGEQMIRAQIVNANEEVLAEDWLNVTTVAS